MNKLLVITGGTKGIGRALLEKFASNGFDIATCARNEKDLAQLEHNFSTNYKNTTLYAYRADLSIKEETIAFAQFIKNLKRAKIYSAFSFYFNFSPSFAFEACSSYLIPTLFIRMIAPSVIRSS